MDAVITPDDKKLTIPNVISVTRIVAVMVFAYLVLWGYSLFTCAWLLAAIGCTDKIDGWIARKFNLVSRLGATLDVVADRTYYIVGGLALFINGTFPRLVIALIVLRELTQSSLYLYADKKCDIRLEVSIAGKRATFLLMVGIPLLLLSVSPGHADWRSISLFLVGGGYALSWFATEQYWREFQIRLATKGL